MLPSTSLGKRKKQEKKMQKKEIQRKKIQKMKELILKWKGQKASIVCTWIPNRPRSTGVTNP
jgi:hypothetical protein